MKTLLATITAIGIMAGAAAAQTRVAVMADTNGVVVLPANVALEPAWTAVSNVVTEGAAKGATALQTELDPAWTAVSNTVTDGAAAGATALQPNAVSGTDTVGTVVSNGQVTTVGALTPWTDYVPLTDPAYTNALTNVTAGAGISVTGSGRTREIASTITQYTDAGAVAAIKADAAWNATDWDNAVS